MTKLQDAFRNPTYLAVINAVIVLIVAAQQYFLDSYNTFKVYQNSVYHFFQKLPLYDTYPDQYVGHFFYSPTFSLLFIPFAYLPTPVAILGWAIMLMMAFYYGLRLLPIQRDKMLFIYFFSLISLVTALQSFDTGPIVAAGIFSTFIYAERKDYFRATFFPNISFFVKGYAAIGACFLLMRRFKPRVYPYVLFWFSFFLLLPLIKYSPSELYDLYQSWGESYGSGRDANVGVSVMGLLQGIGSEIPAIYVQLLGAGLLISTMLVVSLRKNYGAVKFHFLSYVLIWVVIFNHLASTPTYIIAVPGVAIWYLISRRDWPAKALLLITFVLTSLAPTDLFPAIIKEQVIRPYSLMALGPFLVLVVLQYELWFKHAVKAK